MKSFLLKRAGFLSSGVLALGIIMAGVGYAVNSLRAQSSPQGFTVSYRQTVQRPGDNEPLLISTRERHQKQNGEWRQLTTRFDPLDGRPFFTTDEFAVLGRGVFKVDEKNKQLIFLSQMPDKALPPPTAQELGTSANYVKHDRVLGYEVVVQRSMNHDNTGYLEFYLAPALQGLPLKVVRTSTSNAGTLWDITEATNVQMGEFSEKVFADIPADLPISNSHYEERMQKMQQNMQGI